MNPSDVLIRPIQSEKTDMIREKNLTYEFHVNIKANKIEIKKAVESIFQVKVDSVTTLVRKGKTKRLGRFMGHTPDRKRAFVTLEPGNKLNIFEGA